MLHLQNFLRALLNHMRDGVAVCGAEYERLQNEQVESALQHVGFERMSLAAWHLFSSIP